MKEKDSIISPPQLTLKGLTLAAIIGLAYSAIYSLLLVNAGSISVSGFVFNAGIRFLIKFLILLGCWWIIFRLMHDLGDIIKIVAHIFLSLGYAVIWFYSYSLAYVLYIGADISQTETFIGVPFWIALTALFEYLVVFSILHILYSNRKLRIREKQANELRALATQQQISTLKAQLNPHFLFNTLNSINAMGSRDIRESRNMVTKLSDMLRYSIRSFDEELTPLHDEIRFIKKYLELEKHRYGDRLDYSISADSSLSGMEISPMTIQPLVENAVKHGISGLKEGGRIEVSITRQNGQVRVSVKDTGIGLHDDFDVSRTVGVGLKNTNEYLITKFGPEHRLRFENVSPHGTVVWFNIPLHDD